jgi:hypothetical protein
MTIAKRFNSARIAVGEELLPMRASWREARNVALHFPGIDDLDDLLST